MSDPRNTYVVDFTARMATQKYRKVRIGQGIGSQLGARFRCPFRPCLGSIFILQRCKWRRRKGVDLPTTFGRNSQRWPLSPLPSADFRKTADFIGSYWERVAIPSRENKPGFIGHGGHFRSSDLWVGHPRSSARMSGDFIARFGQRVQRE